jgi:hypothetical protein
VFVAGRGQVRGVDTVGEAEGGERDSEIQQTATHMQFRVTSRMSFIHSERGVKESAYTTCVRDGSIWDMLRALK